MDINTVKTVYNVSLDQDELLSIMHAARTYMKSEFPELWDLVKRSDAEIVFEVTEGHSYG